MDFAGLGDLPVIGGVACIDRRAGGADRQRPNYFGQLPDQRETSAEPRAIPPQRQCALVAKIGAIRLRCDGWREAAPTGATPAKLSGSNQRVARRRQFWRREGRRLAGSGVCFGWFGADGFDGVAGVDRPVEPAGGPWMAVTSSQA